jgi:hypothetical protein
MKARYRELIEKSIAGMVAAIEVYNKPDFRYREEIFSIIAVNAWELACKAYILKLSDNRLSNIYVYEKGKNKDGSVSKRMLKKKSNSGNPITLSLKKSLNKIESLTNKPLPQALRANISSLEELRDNSIHFYNRGIPFTKLLQELGSATLKNYVQALTEWFGIDMFRYNFYLMPISFFAESSIVHGLVLSKEEQRFLDFIRILEKEASESSPYDVTINVDIKFIKSNTSDAIKLQLATGEGLAKVQLTEEQIRQQYPWDYDELNKRMRKRYKDFKITKKYHELRKATLGDKRYAKTRYLDPAKPQSGKKVFYNPNILNYFDQYYTKD